MIVERRVQYKTNERVQKLPVPAGSRVIGAFVEKGLPDWIILRVEYPSEESRNDSILNVRLMTKVPEGRDAPNCNLVCAVQAGQRVVMVYQVTARRRSDDFLFEPLLPGVSIKNLGAGVAVNTPCPIRMINGKPNLVYRADLRSKGQSICVIFINAKSDDTSEVMRLTENAHVLTDNGTVVGVPVPQHPHYALYVSPAALKATNA